MGDRPEDGARVLIREGRPADEPFVVALGTLAFARFGDYDPILRGFLGQADVASWIAESAGAAVGFALVERPVVLAGFADLVAIAVDPRHRRRGIARALLAAVIEDSEHRREPLLALTVADDNDPAIDLFRAFGFRMTPGSAGRYARGQRSRRMVRTPVDGGPGLP